MKEQKIKLMLAIYLALASLAIILFALGLSNNQTVTEVLTYNSNANGQMAVTVVGPNNYNITQSFIATSNGPVKTYDIYFSGLKTNSLYTAYITGTFTSKTIIPFGISLVINVNQTRYFQSGSINTLISTMNINSGTIGIRNS